PEFVAYELKKLVGWGADPKRLAFSPRLRTLAGIDVEASLVTAGYVVRRFVIQQIASLSGSYQFDGRMIEAEKLKQAYRLLLQFAGRREWAEVRRYEVIVLLEVYCSIDKWRRAVGPEMELMLILARHMTKSPNL